MLLTLSLRALSHKIGQRLGKRPLRGEFRRRWFCGLESRQYRRLNLARFLPDGHHRHGLLPLAAAVRDLDGVGYRLLRPDPKLLRSLIACAGRKLRFIRGVGIGRDPAFDADHQFGRPAAFDGGGIRLETEFQRFCSRPQLFRFRVVDGV